MLQTTRTSYFRERKREREIILDFPSATLKARRLWKIFIGYWEKGITNQKFHMWSRYHLSIKEKDVHFQTYSDSEKGAEKPGWDWYCYNIIIENVGINITIMNRTVYNK